MNRRLLSFVFVGALSSGAAVEAGPIGLSDLSPQASRRMTWATTFEAYNPASAGSGSTGAWADPANALGMPDYADHQHFTSLGLGGSLTLGFGEGALTGSGTAAPDLFVHEVGPDVEDTLVWASADGNTWASLGRISGGTTAVDIDALGFGTNDAFSFVRLMDDPNQGLRSGLTVGADIDAVGVVNSAPVPEPGALILVGSGLAGILARRRLAKRVS